MQETTYFNSLAIALSIPAAVANHWTNVFVSIDICSFRNPIAPAYQLHPPLWRPMPIVWPVYCTYGPSIPLAHSSGSH
jgi:hypothetical protein